MPFHLSLVLILFTRELFQKLTHEENGPGGSHPSLCLVPPAWRPPADRPGWSSPLRPWIRGGLSLSDRAGPCAGPASGVSRNGRCTYGTAFRDPRLVRSVCSGRGFRSHCPSSSMSDRGAVSPRGRWAAGQLADLSWGAARLERSWREDSQRTVVLFRSLLRSTVSLAMALFIFPVEAPQVLDGGLTNTPRELLVPFSSTESSSWSSLPMHYSFEVIHVSLNIYLPVDRYLQIKT